MTKTVTGSFVRPPQDPTAAHSGYTSAGDRAKESVNLRRDSVVGVSWKHISAACEICEAQSNGIKDNSVVMFAHPRPAGRRQLPREFWEQQRNSSGNCIFRRFSEPGEYTHYFLPAEEYQFR